MQGRYPLSRPLYVYVNKDPNKDWDPKIREFLRFINSRDGQETVARAGVYPLSSSQVSHNVELIQGKRLHASH
jgi:phosphate transport system substrate-binding protein